MTLAKQETNKNTKQKQQQTHHTIDQRQVSVDGETCGEKKVKRPKLSCLELHEEAKSIPCPAQLGMKLISHSIVFIPVPPSWIGICARGGSIAIVERCKLFLNAVAVFYSQNKPSTNKKQKHKVSILKFHHKGDLHI